MSFPTSPGSRRCICPVPSRHALAFAGSPTARHSRCYQFRGLLIHHCYDLSSCLPPFQETFTSELSTAWSPSPLSDITTVATEQFHRRDFHPQDQQLASLHGLTWFIGVKAFLFVHLPIMLLAATTDVWLFYVQHQFQQTTWE